MVSVFVDWSYYSQVIPPTKTLSFLIKMHFILRSIMLYTEKFVVANQVTNNYFIRALIIIHTNTKKRRASSLVMKP